MVPAYSLYGTVRGGELRWDLELGEPAPSGKHKGSDFDSFLKEEGLAAEADAVAAKRMLAHQLETAMKKKHLSKVSMAKRMQTNRSALDRLLDPENSSVTLQTLENAATVLGKKLRISLK